jgi:nicotinate phosphoribosyltransferase
VSQPHPHRGGAKDDPDTALLTDLYQLTMVQAYWNEGMDRSAVFSLFFRHLPPGRNYLLACGLEDVLDYLEALHFSEAAIGELRSLGSFTDPFLEWLSALRFTGDVYALSEGTPVFPTEPLLEVVAPIAEAQLVESVIMNQIHLQTVLASKAARVVTAAQGRPVVDFGLRRMHGTDAALKGSRAFFIAGVAATSNVLAGCRYGIPVSGTMAHSYIQAHDHEIDALRAYATLYPDTILLVDSYDTLEGVRNVIKLASELGPDFRVRGIRLDSGDLGALALKARALLDDAGLAQVEIFASNRLDETAIAELIAAGAPINGFGVGTLMGVSNDAPTVDMAYKLTEYAGSGRLKSSPGKTSLPGRKQVFRIEHAGRATHDILARYDEQQPGRPLLKPVMKAGKRLSPAVPRDPAHLEAARARAVSELSLLPARIRGLEVADPPYPVELSPSLRAEQARLLPPTENGERG